MSEQTSASPETTAATTAPPTAPTTTITDEDASGRQPASPSAAAAELSRAKISLLGALRRFPDFPIPGINFVDIMPLFRDPETHALLIRCLELQVVTSGAFGTEGGSSGSGGFAFGASRPDVVVGLDARGFLFGPALALRLGAGFAAVRKKGKLPGPCVTAAYEKEYGSDFFQMQEDALAPGQKVLIVDDIIATGGSAAAAGDLVRQLGGELMGYLFILEIPFLKGRDKLGDIPVVTVLEDA